MAVWIDFEVNKNNPNLEAEMTGEWLIIYVHQKEKIHDKFEEFEKFLKNVS